MPDFLAPRPEFRLHAALGRIPVAEDELLLPLTEARLPVEWLAVDEDLQMEKQLEMVREHLQQQQHELVAVVDVSDRHERDFLLQCRGSRAGDRPFQIVMPLDDAGLRALLSTNPSSVWITGLDGAPVLLLEGNWDGIFIYA